MKTVVLYGEACEADRLVPIQGAPHFALPVSLPGIGPRLEMMDELIESGLRTQEKFTVDPRPVDVERMELTPSQTAYFQEVYGKQDQYEKKLKILGLRDDKAFTCTCYLPEVGNTPGYGDIVAWSESSAVIYANSVLGARTNRNGAVMDLLCNIIGKTPHFGLLTDEGRQAKWLFVVKTSNLPDPQLLGGAIGRCAGEDVLFISGLDRFFEPRLGQDTRDYLKDMGAACSAIGAVGLFHVENITPEARMKKKSLLHGDYQTKVIDDGMLQGLYESYPVLWKDRKAKPKWCLIGCPHLSLDQLRMWTTKILEILRAKHQSRLEVETVLCAAPDVIDRFMPDGPGFDEMREMGITVSAMCGELFMNNPHVSVEPVITNSNKLRAYTTARYFQDQEILEIIVRGRRGNVT